jgi:hypothetical protein
MYDDSFTWATTYMHMETVSYTNFVKKMDKNTIKYKVDSLLLVLTSGKR